MTGQQRATYLREQLAAMESYGNGHTPAAETIRAELAELTPTAPRRTKKETDRG